MGAHQFLRFATVVVLFVTGFPSIAQGGFSADSVDFGQNPWSQALVDVSACSDLLLGKAGESGKNTLHQNGFSHDGVPTRLFGAIRAGGFYCLEEGPPPHVDAVFLEFRDQAGEVVVSWLIAPDSQADLTEWRDYLEFFYEDQFPVELLGSDHSVIAIRPDRAGASLARNIVLEQRAPRVSLWDTMQPILAKRAST